MLNCEVFHRIRDVMETEKWWTIHDLFCVAGANGAHVDRVEPTGQIIVLEDTRAGIKGIPYRFLAFARKYTNWEEQELIPLAEAWGDAIASLNSNWELRIVRGEAIREAYATLFNRDGLRSCMTGYKAQYTELYTMYPEQIGLALGYRNKKVAARALVWEVDSGAAVYDRVYAINASFASEFAALLEKNGYRRPTRADTVTLDGIWDIDSFSYPYMDTFRYGIIEGRKLQLMADDYGAVYVFDDTEGGYRGTSRCDRCGAHVPEEDLVYVDDVDEYWCESCVDYAFSCDRCGDIVTEVVHIEDVDEHWCQRCAEQHASECDSCGDLVAKVGSNGMCEACDEG